MVNRVRVRAGRPPVAAVTAVVPLAWVITRGPGRPTSAPSNRLKVLLRSCDSVDVMHTTTGVLRG